MTTETASIGVNLATSAATMILKAKPGSVITVVVVEPNGALMLRSSHQYREALAGIDEAKGLLHEAIGRMEGRLHTLHPTLQ